MFNNNSKVKTIFQTENHQIISGDSNGYLKVWTPQNLGNYLINYRDNIENIFKYSIIVNDDEKEMVCKWIESSNNSISSTELLYRLTRDGDSAQTFHSKCDGKGTTITFIKNYSNGFRFGGYTTASWTSNSGYKSDSNAFLFSLNNRKKFPLKNTSDSNAIYHNSSYGPTFGGGHDIYFGSGNWSSSNNASFNPYSYTFTVLDMIGVNSSSTSFRVSDLEVWLIK
jgi:hypothetical protein